MYSANVFSDTDVFDALNDAARRFPSFINNQVDRLIQRDKADIKAEILIEPPLPTLPFVWSLDPVANASARGWYFANKVERGSAGGRYPRTGALLDAYDIQVDTSEGSGVFIITNDAPGAEFVIGNRQVVSHGLSGWGDLDETALRFSERMTNNLIDIVLYSLDDLAGF